MMSLSKLKSLLSRYPVVPSMVAFGVLFPSANVIQQTCFQKKPPGSQVLDLKEVTRFSLYGGLFAAPVIHNWVRLMSRMIPRTTLPYVILKVMIDQLCLGPVLLSAFLIILTAMEGRSREDIVKQWKDKFLPTFSTAVSVWPVIMAVNYKFVPLRFRTVYIAVCNFFWIIFLAHQKNREVPWKSPLFRILT